MGIAKSAWGVKRLEKAEVQGPPRTEIDFEHFEDPFWPSGGVNTPLGVQFP